MQNAADVETKLAEAFSLMYGHLPHSAMLVHKSKRIVALNAPARIMGREPGKICAKLGPARMHAGCLALKALSEQKTQCKRAKTPQNKDLMVYWLPVAGHNEYYVHIVVDI